MAEDYAGVIIGLEIHLQLATKAKLFCECPSDYRNAEINTQICPICTSQPGSKPMSLNKTAVKNLLKLVIALNGKLDPGAPIAVQRKHYFYPDLPSNYQRTSKPIAVKGKLGKIGIWELHIEEDPGRYDLKTGKVDYNRSGVPLVETVTAPDFRSPEEAREFLDELQAITNYLGNIRSEPGSMKVDANISFKGGKRVEVKNINSFKGVYTALKYEIVRQKNMFASGIAVEQETRHYDEGQGVTTGMRKKETAEDYRYIPDPDELPLVITKELIEEAKKEMPELPRAKVERFVKSYKIREDSAWVVCGELELANLFEKLAKEIDPQKLAFWISGPLKKQLNYRTLFFKESGLRESDIKTLSSKFIAGEITDKVMEQKLIEMLNAQASGKHFELKLEEVIKISDSVELEKIVKQAIASNPKVVEDFKAGNDKSLNFLAGQIMKQTKGRADAQAVMQLIRKLVQ
ncbi:Aspartyl/glutamyl-tRNA(Asn/Gln) amidotransferase subunit B [Candidatus Gugararchaeum adminiculabundum]|nr:Aspartyl/glutamyl-tRNA(Asn/Gln) amidotransferase subunit B [Candidatus Gugararchaeum adminiculabundum]